VGEERRLNPGALLASKHPSLPSVWQSKINSFGSNVVQRRQASQLDLTAPTLSFIEWDGLRRSPRDLQGHDKQQKKMVTYVPK
jgi:hypothetical protein